MTGIRALIALALLCVAPSAMAWTILSSGLRGYQTKSLTVYVNTTGCSVAPSAVLEAVDKAITVWNGVATSSLALSRADSTATAAEFLAGTATASVPLIVCDTSFGANNPGVNVDGVPAATRTGTSNPLDYSAVLLNSQAGALAAIDQLSQERLNITLVHELGHALGLGHSSNPAAMMYYSIAGKTVAYLTEDDRDGITYLYPRNEFEGGAFGCAAVHRPESRLGDLSGVLICVGLGVLGYFSVRWRVRQI